MVERLPNDLAVTPKTGSPPWRHLVETEIDRAGWTGTSRVECPAEDLTVLVHDAFTERDVRQKVEGATTCSLTIVLEGDGAFAMDGQPAITFSAGTAILCAAAASTGGINTFRGSTRFRIVDLRFEPGLLARSCAGLSALIAKDRAADRPVCSCLIRLDASASLLRVARGIASCQMPEGLGRRLFLQSKAIEGLCELVRSLDGAATEAGRWRPRERQKIEAARRLLEARFQQNWTIARLARQVGLNEKQLKSGFRQIVGTPVHAYLRRWRLEAAGELLREGCNVTEAALAVGFGNLSHFSKIFKDHTGASPRDFVVARKRRSAPDRQSPAARSCQRSESS